MNYIISIAMEIVIMSIENMSDIINYAAENCGDNRAFKQIINI